MEKILPLKPVITRISGGLGNQLFQYALGRALAIESGAALKLDLSSYSHRKPHEAVRTYTLDKFNIEAQVAAKNDFKSIGIPDPADQGFMTKLKRRLIRMRESDKAFHERRIILESSFGFIPDILNVKSGAFLAGVWQSEKYFKKYADQIRKDLALKEPLSSKALEIQGQMNANESVAIHIRRGDQVRDPNLVKKHGLLTNDYYANAIGYMKSKLSNPRFFVFSDEIEWVKRNMGFDSGTVYVSESNLPDYEELALMSSCKHQIIAKSSFSWWGAWLNQNPKKIVVAPKRRFAQESTEAQDLIPESWIRL